MLERGVGSGAAKNAIRNARLTGSRTKTESRPHFFRCLLLSQLAPLRAGTPAAAGGLALPIASTLGSTLAATDGARRVGGDVTGTAGRYLRPGRHSMLAACRPAFANFWRRATVAAQRVLGKKSCHRWAGMASCSSCSCLGCHCLGWLPSRPLAETCVLCGRSPPRFLFFVLSGSACNGVQLGLDR